MKVKHSTLLYRTAYLGHLCLCYTTLYCTKLNIVWHNIETAFNILKTNFDVGLDTQFIVMALLIAILLQILKWNNGENAPILSTKTNDNSITIYMNL